MYSKLSCTDCSKLHGKLSPRQTLKRVKYSQMPNYQLFKKIQLAFDHVRTPLKSELNFYKSLIFNNLTKFNSLQTLSVYFSTPQPTIVFTTY